MKRREEKQRCERSPACLLILTVVRFLPPKMRRTCLRNLCIEDKQKLRAGTQNERDGKALQGLLEIFRGVRRIDTLGRHGKKRILGPGKQGGVKLCELHRRPGDPVFKKKLHLYIERIMPEHPTPEKATARTREKE